MYQTYLALNYAAVCMCIKNHLNLNGIQREMKGYIEVSKVHHLRFIIYSMETRYSVRSSLAVVRFLFSIHLSTIKKLNGWKNG